jgi:hypothetical protein
MDGGLRDSINREAPEPGSELADELARSFAAAEQRRARLQPLIDER